MTGGRFLSVLIALLLALFAGAYGMSVWQPGTVATGSPGNTARDADAVDRTVSALPPIVRLDGGADPTTGYRSRERDVATLDREAVREEAPVSGTSDVVASDTTSDASGNATEPASGHQADDSGPSDKLLRHADDLSREASDQFSQWFEREGLTDPDDAEVAQADPETDFGADGLARQAGNPLQAPDVSDLGDGSLGDGPLDARPVETTVLEGARDFAGRTGEQVASIWRSLGDLDDSDGIAGRDDGDDAAGRPADLTREIGALEAPETEAVPGQSQGQLEGQSVPTATVDNTDADDLARAAAAEAARRTQEALAAEQAAAKDAADRERELRAIEDENRIRIARLQKARIEEEKERRRLAKLRAEREARREAAEQAKREVVRKAAEEAERRRLARLEQERVAERLAAEQAEKERREKIRAQTVLRRNAKRALKMASLDFTTVHGKPGQLRARGSSLPNSQVALYVDGRALAMAKTSSTGRWAFDEELRLAAREHKLRVDVFDSSGKMLARLSRRFTVAEPEALRVAALPVRAPRKFRSGERAPVRTTLQVPNWADDILAGRALPERRRIASRTLERPRVKDLPERVSRVGRMSLGLIEVSATPKRKNWSQIEKSRPRDLRRSARKKRAKKSRLKRRRLVRRSKASSKRSKSKRASRKRLRKSKRARRSKKRVARKLSRYHRVRQGDTLWTIAQRYYGNGRKYRRLLRRNKGLVSNPHYIRPNQRLRIR